MFSIGDKVRLNTSFKMESYPNKTIVIDGLDITPDMQDRINRDAAYTIHGLTDGNACELEEIPAVFWPNSIFGKVKSKNLEYVESVIPMHDIDFIRKMDNSSRTWFREFAFVVSLPDDDDKINSTYITIIQITGDKKTDRVAVIGFFPIISRHCVMLCNPEDIHQTILDVATKYVKGDVKVELLLVDKNNLNL